jgi:hypothetical protein
MYSSRWKEGRELLTWQQCDTFESKLHACSGADGRRVEAVSVLLHWVGALDHVRPIQNFPLGPSHKHV